MTTPDAPLPTLDRVTLTGTHVELAPLGTEHAAALARACAPGTLDLFSRTPDSIEPATPEDAERYVEEALAGWLRGKYLPFVVLDRVTGDVLGATRYGDIDLEVPRMGIGWTWYSEHVRGTVVNPECKLLLLEHAFDTLGAGIVSLWTSGFNERSHAAIIKLGATRDGVLRRHVYQRDGRLRDTVIFSILAERWPEVRAGLEARVEQQGAAWAG